MPTLAETLGGYAAGRYTPTPTPGISNELYVAQMTKLVGMYTQIANADANIKQATVTGYVTTKTEAMRGLTSLMGSMAEFAKASADKSQASASLFGHSMSAFADLSAKISLSMPDDAVVEKVRVAAEAATSAGLGLPDEKMNEVVTKNADGTYKVNDAGFLAVIQQSPIAQYITNTSVEVNKLGADDPLRFNTARAAEEMGARWLHTSLVQEEAERGYPPGTLTSRGAALQAAVLTPHFTGNPTIAPLKAKVDESRAEAQSMVAQMYKDFDSMSQGISAPKDIVAKIKGEFDALSELTASPLVFGEKMAEIPSNAGIVKSQKYVTNAIDDLEKLREGKPDRLEAAYQRWYSMPGFAPYVEAMQFADAKAGARYAAKHPNEYIRFLGWAKADPALLQDTTRLKAKIAEHGRSTQVGGGPVGYFTRPIERTFGVRVPGAAPVLTDEQQASVDAAAGSTTPALFDSLPEAPGEPSNGPPSDGYTGPRALLPVTDDKGTRMQEVRSPHLVQTDAPSRVVDLNGQKYQELEDGAYVILDGRGAGKRIEVGDHLWFPIAQDIEEVRGSFDIAEERAIRNLGDRRQEGILDLSGPQAPKLADINAPSAPSPASEGMGKDKTPEAGPTAKKKEATAVAKAVKAKTPADDEQEADWAEFEKEL